MMYTSDDEGDSTRGHADGKIVHDPIHGQISLSPLLLRVLDTPEFQRLRDLKQLGSAYLVFPGASHNRFEHCLGVAHLAEQMLTHIRDTQPELQVSPRDIELVKLAGLCHDLGHGPFSHLFEDFVKSVDPTGSFHHERMSLQILELLLKNHRIPMPEGDMQFLRELINPTHNPTQSHPRKYLYDVVANARNSVDVDKMDYLQRDCHNLGMSTNLKHDRLIRHCRVIQNEICYNSKEVYNLYDLFHTRYSLHKQVYTHRVSKSIEFMIVDVFKLADPVLGLSAATRDPSSYVKLTDCVLKQIENSTDARLAAARALLVRIRTRKLYRLVDESVLPVDSPKVLASVTAKMLLDHYPQARADGLTESDLRVHNLRINYAMADKNPVDMIKFFHKSDLNVSFHIPKSTVSHIVPEHFQERVLRVFLTEANEEKMSAARAAVAAFLDSNGCGVHQAPVRCNSSPGGLHSAHAPVRGGSIFSRALQAAQEQQQLQQHQQQQRLRVTLANHQAGTGGGDDGADIPPSQGTAVTEIDTDMNDASGAGSNGAASSSKQGAVSFAMPEASFAPVAGTDAAAASADASLRTPTKRAQAKSARAGRHAHEATPPPTVLLDRYAPHEEEQAQHASAPATAAALFTPAPAAAPASAVAATPAAASAASSFTPLSSRTPSKRRNTVLRDPATPAGKLAAAASRGATPATNSSRGGYGFAATPGGVGATPASGAQAKRQKVAHTPLVMQPLPPSSARASPPAAAASALPALSSLDERKDGEEDAVVVAAAPVAAAPAPPAAVSSRPVRANSKKGVAAASDAVPSATPAAATRTPSATAKTLHY